MKKLTIGIGCTKSDGYIRQTLQSIVQWLKVRNFTKYVKIFICKDTNENCINFEIAKQYEYNYPKLIKCIDNKRNIGISRTYQKMLNRANTSYFMAFDQDDIINNFDIDKALNFLDLHNQYCGSYALKFIFDENGHIYNLFGGVYSKFDFSFSLNHNAMILRVSDAKKQNGYMPKWLKKKCIVAPDVVMWINMILNKDFYLDDTVRTFYREYNGCHHIKNGKLYDQQFDRIKKSLTKYFDNKQILTINENIIKYSIIKNDLNQKQQQLMYKSFSNKQLYQQSVFFNYLSFIYKNYDPSFVLTQCFCAIMRNPNLKFFITSFLINSKLINIGNDSVVKLLQLNKQNYNSKAINPNEYRIWFRKFIIENSIKIEI